jgi:hypothetical protein
MGLAGPQGIKARKYAARDGYLLTEKSKAVATACATRTSRTMVFTQFPKPRQVPIR